MVKKSGPAYRCGECGAVVAKWFGRCPECQAWGTIEEVAAVRAALAKVAAGAPASPARPIAEVDVESARAQRTGVPELDRVLGGGLVPGAVVLLAGEPGVGKSTLLLEVAYQWVARKDSPGRALYITGEESAGQVRLRAERTGNVHQEMFLAAESDLATVIGHVDAVKPAMLVIDSVQTMSSPAVESSAGGVTQVRAVTAALVALAKERSLPVILVGHVTKEGSVAGPRVLEHLVDVVLHFEGDKYSSLRLVRGVKNRFGPADEVGCFEMVEDGILGVPDPSGIFMSNRVEGVPGTAVTVIMEGKRALLGEVQALVAATDAPMPRRAVNGLEASRVAKVLAVLERRASLPLGKSDVFTATVGGMRIIEPAGDLALAMAVASAKLDIPLPNDMVIIGEVGLAGEVRRVASVGRRLGEAARLGFKRALIPPDAGRLPPEIKATVVPDLRTLVDTLSKR